MLDSCNFQVITIAVVCLFVTLYVFVTEYRLSIILQMTMRVSIYALYLVVSIRFLCPGLKVLSHQCTIGETSSERLLVQKKLFMLSTLPKDQERLPKQIGRVPSLFPNLDRAPRRIQV
jgi:hypothetical protein